MKTPKPTPRTQPTAAQVKKIVQREQYKALVDEVRGPAVPKLSGEALKHAQKGSFS